MAFLCVHPNVVILIQIVLTEIINNYYFSDLTMHGIGLLESAIILNY